MMGVMALISFLLLIASLGGKTPAGELFMEPVRMSVRFAGAGRKMTGVDESVDQNDVKNPEPTTQITVSPGRSTKHVRISPVNSEVMKLFEGQPTVEVYKLAPRKNAAKTHFDQEVLKTQIRTQGFIIPASQGSLSGKSRNRTVTDEDIKRTLAILDQKLEHDQKELMRESMTGVLNWNTTDQQRVMLITSWRSGSTFLGQILSDHPGVFNHYEPLMHVGLKQIRGGDEAREAVEHLRDLLQCKYNNEDYIRKIKENMSDMASHNAQVWQACIQGPNRNTCTNTAFLQQACGRFPIVASKIVRLRLNLTQELLATFKDLKILYLVRDPRATMNSRLSSVKWCSASADCIDAERLCQDIQNDLDAFEQLSHAYPTRVALIKYETMANHPQMTFRAIFDFAGLTFTHKIQETILRHTSRNEDQPWSTVRKSAERVNLWKSKLSKEVVGEIQQACSSVLNRLGYPLA